MSITVQHRRGAASDCEAATPADGEILADTTLDTLRLGDGATLGGFKLKKWGYSYLLSPAQITGDQNNYGPTNLAWAETLYLDLDADRALTGLSGGSTAREIVIVNASAFRLTLKHESSSSTAGNRFSLPGAVDVVVPPGGSVKLVYKSVLSRWIASGSGFLAVTNLPESVTLTGVLSPSQITADQNNYNPAGLSLTSHLRLTSDAPRSVTGFAGGAKGRVLIVSNEGSNAITFKNADTNSTAANRLDIGADVTLSGKQCAIFKYDDADSRWKMLANTAGAAVADGAVTAVKLAASARAGNIVNGKVVESHIGNAVTIAIKTLAGADPTASDPVYVRVADQAGAYTWMTLTAATSIVLSSGSSAGSTNGAAFKLWLLAINDAGTFRLGLVNCATSALGVLPLHVAGVISSTAEGGAGAADSAGVVYTGTAVTGKSYTPLAYLEWQSGLTTAGNWDASPTIIGLWREGVPLPGTIIYRARSEYATWSSSLSATIPFDNTVPQISEGTEINSVAVVPMFSNSLMYLDSVLVANGSGSPSSMLSALFVAGTSNAIKANAAIAPAASYFQLVALSALHAPGAVTSQTYSQRVGPESGTMRVNGTNAGQLLNGASCCHLEVREIIR